MLFRSPSAKYHEKSHGESFLALAQNNMNPNGLYLFDEPEAALSPQRQLTLLMQIYRCAKEGAQFIIVTHSPILLGIPDADIYCFDNGRIHLCEYEDTESYQVTEMFINNRQMLLDRLLYKCGFEIIMTETKVPLTVRRTIAFSRAVYEGNAEVEHVTAKLTDGPEQIDDRIKKGYIPLLVDPGLKYLKEYKADVVVDAILAKKNLGTTIDAAEFVIGVGPGFTAGKDCHVVVETMRGHNLGKVIHEGCAIPNTGIPAEVGGYSVERIIRASADGLYEPVVKIGDHVEKDQIIAYRPVIVITT